MAKVLALVALVVVVLIAAALLYASSQWDTGTVRLRARLEQARAPIAPLRYDPSQLDSLPAPVSRYLGRVLRPGQPMIAGVHLRHTGTFNLSDSSQRWVPFSSDQRVITRRPGFDWNARIAVMPRIAVRVHDAYIGGEGLLHAALLAMFPLAIQRGTREMAEGELMRFLAESPWYPTVRLVAGVTVPTPWIGRWSDWMWLNGVRVPTRGEVAWLLPSGPLPYWRGGVIGITYELARGS